LFGQCFEQNIVITCAYRAGLIKSVLSLNLIRCFKPQRSVKHPLVDRRKKSYNHKVLIDCHWYHTLILKG